MGTAAIKIRNRSPYKQMESSPLWEEMFFGRSRLRLVEGNEKGWRQERVFLSFFMEVILPKKKPQSLGDCRRVF